MNSMRYWCQASVFTAVMWSCLSLSSIVTSNAVYAAPSPEQIAAFQALPPEQQQEILRSQGAQQQASGASAEELDTPEVVAPRAVEDDKKIEQNANEATDSIELAEKPEEKVVREPLKQFGYELFAGTPSTFAPVSDIPVPSDYIMGPGDTLVVQYYGKQNIVNNLTVNREGEIQLPSVGPVPIAGLSFDEVKQSLNTIVENQLIGVKANITLGKLRSIRVFVLGEAFRPGSYTVSSLSTMTNALFVSGGITSVGSLRNIQLKRNGEVVAELDLYDLLLNGDTSNDVRLLPGDVLFIPPIGKTVGVSGEVRRAAIYEIKHERTAAELIQLAGGLLPTAYPQASRIERINSKGERTLVDINLTQSAGKQRRIYDGDVVQIFSILDKMEDVVLLNGHVQRPGGFQWKKGLRVTDVIPDVQSLKAVPDLDYALIKREIQPTRELEVIYLNLGQALQNPKSKYDLFLKPRDEIYVFGLDGARTEQVQPILSQLRKQATFNNPPAIVNIQGNVRFPGSYPLFQHMSLYDLIKSSFDLQEGTDLDYAVIERRIDDVGSIEVLKVDLNDLNSSKFVPLQPRDSVRIFHYHQPREELLEDIITQLNAQRKYETMANVVSIQGSVRFPGSYPLTDKLNVRDLIRYSGGLVEQADESYLLIVRKLNGRGDIQVLQTRLDKELKKPTRLTREDQVLLFYVNGSRQAELEATLNRLRAQATDVKPVEIVSISGHVRFPGEYPLQPNMTVEQLIDAAGGFTQDAYTLEAEVTRQEVGQNRESEIVHRKVSLTESDINGLGYRLSAKERLLIKRVPNWVEQETVQIFGEVRFPGTYVISKGETLHDLVKRAGGLTEYADPRAAVFTREALRQKEQRQLDKFREDLKKDLAQQEIQQNAAGKEASTVNASLINQLESTKASGRLVIDLAGILDGNENLSQVLLREGDALAIPRTMQEVTVVGEVNFSTSHIYQPGFDLDDYVYGSGGYTEKANKGQVYVIKANGLVRPIKSQSWFGSSNKSIEPGDTIVVPYDAEDIGSWEQWKNVSQILFQLATTAAALQTVGAL